MAKLKWNMAIPFPKDNYVLTITDASFTSSKRTDNPMGLFEMEVFSPSEVTSGANEVTVAGVPLKHYVVTKVMAGESADTEKTENALARVKEFYEKCGVDYSTFNSENPDFSAFVGKKIWVILRSKKTEKRKEATPEQIAKGEQGTVLKDPITGQDAVQFYPEIDSFWGPFQG